MFFFFNVPASQSLSYVRRSGGRAERCTETNNPTCCVTAYITTLCTVSPACWEEKPTKQKENRSLECAFHAVKLFSLLLLPSEGSGQCLQDSFRRADTKQTAWASLYGRSRSRRVDPTFHPAILLWAIFSRSLESSLSYGRFGECR